MTIRASDYDPYADELASYTVAREQGGLSGDGLLRQLLDLLGDVAGLRVLDAACGDGYLARVLAARGAAVTGIDLGPRLIERARRRDQEGAIDYRVADLSKPLPGERGAFDESGATSPYQGLWSRGIKTYLRHRTLEEYLDAFIAAGLRLVKLADSRDHCFLSEPDSTLPEGGRFPRFLLLAFTRP